MTNVPQEPDEFQTRMRVPDPNEDTSNTHRTSEGAGAPPPQFAPPGLGAAAQPQPAASQQQPSQPPQPSQGYGQPGNPFGQPGPTQQAYAQPPQGFGQHSQPAFGQQPAQGAPFGQPAQQQPGYPQGGYGQQPGAQAGAGWGAAQPTAPHEPGPLKAAFDLRFGSYATPGIVKIVYVLGIVLAALWWIGMIIGAFGAFAPTRDMGFGIAIPGTPVPGIIAILIGWIPAAVFVLLLRIGLELALSNVRTAMDVKILRERSDADAKD